MRARGAGGVGYTRARLVKVVVVTKDVENRQGILPDTSAFPVDGGHSNAGKLHLVRLESGEHGTHTRQHGGSRADGTGRGTTR